MCIKKKLAVFFMAGLLLISFSACKQENYYNSGNHEEQDGYSDSSVLKKVLFKEEEKSIRLGNETQLECILVPGGGIVENCIFESSDETVVAVDNTGKIVALKNGSAIVKATFNGSLTCECTVTVTEMPGVSISADIPQKVYQNDTFQTTVSLNGFDCGMIKLFSRGISGTIAGEGKEIPFNDTHNTVYLVGNQFSINFTVTSENQSMISAFFYDNGEMIEAYTRDMEVLPETFDVYPKTLTMCTGDTVSLASSSTGDIIWSSSDESVASISNGVVVAKNTGTAVITASNGKGSGNLTINVKEKTDKQEEITQE